MQIPDLNAITNIVIELSAISPFDFLKKLQLISPLKPKMVIKPAITETTSAICEKLIFIFYVANARNSAAAQAAAGGALNLLVRTFIITDQ